MVTVEDRLGRLEKQLERYRKLTLILGIVILAGVVMGQANNNATFDSVTCRSLSVTSVAGEKGRVMVGAGAVWVFNAEGNMRVRLGHDSSGNGAITTYSVEGNPLVSLGADNQGGAVWISTRDGAKDRVD